MAREVEVAELGGGAHRITMPLPWALDHVHCYALEGTDGWTIIDAGLGTPGTVRRWSEALTTLGNPHVQRLVITHYHPDHVGCGGLLAELVEPDEIVQGRLDAALSRNAWVDMDVEGVFDHMHGNGMSEEMAREAADDEGGSPVTIPEPTRLVDEGDVVTIGAEDFEVLHLPGHADGHIALHGRTSGRLFGGDVILATISPNVGRWEDTEFDPLGRYFATLDRLADLAPPVVYGGHRAAIEDVPTRAREIRAMHDDRLAVAVGALEGGATSAMEVAAVIWPDGHGMHERRFALVEALAHLERLVADGRAVSPSPFRFAVS
jgi:glyoxylase-like metal-dependent hydrolase (beta-lactamase superfamily II)